MHSARRAQRSLRAGTGLCDIVLYRIILLYYYAMIYSMIIYYITCYYLYHSIIYYIVYAPRPTSFLIARLVFRIPGSSSGERPCATCIREHTHTHMHASQQTCIPAYLRTSEPCTCRPADLHTAYCILHTAWGIPAHTATQTCAHVSACIHAERLADHCASYPYDL